MKRGHWTFYGNHRANNEIVSQVKRTMQASCHSSASEKVLFYKRIKDIEQRLGDESVILNSFILAWTKHPQLQWGKDLDKLKHKHILFMTSDRTQYITNFLLCLGYGDMIKNTFQFFERESRLFFSLYRQLPLPSCPPPRRVPASTALCRPSPASANPTTQPGKTPSSNASASISTASLDWSDGGLFLLN